MSGDKTFLCIRCLYDTDAWRAMMSKRGEKTYRPWEPERYRQGAHSPRAKLPEGDLVFFLLDTMPQLELRRFYAPYEHETRGAPPYDPAMMVCLLLYAYCVGVFSSRKIALACERNLAFVAIVGPDRPDFRTISDFRKLHLEAFQDVFVQVVKIADRAKVRSEEHTSELQSLAYLVCRLLLEKKKKKKINTNSIRMIIGNTPRR